MTPIEIGAAIQAGKAAFDTIRGIADVVTKSQNAAEALQMTAAIAELGSRINEMQAAIYELSRENEQLRHQLDEGAGLEAFKSRYRYEENVSWKYDESGHRIDGPFCPHCVDEGKERRLQPQMGNKDYYRCVVHAEALWKLDGMRW